MIENGANKDYVKPSEGLSVLRIAELETRANMVNYLTLLEEKEKP